MSKFNITVGKIITLAQIIHISQDFKSVGIELKEINDILLSSGSLGGTIPVKDSIRIGHYFEFLIIKERKILFSDYTKENILPYLKEINPSNELIRQILYKILQKNHYPWIINFNHDIIYFKNFIPENWVDLLEAAGLFNLSDKEVLEWWTLIIQDINQMDINREKDIGNIGELITFNFEKERVCNEGLATFINYVIWVSRISDSYGFDIKSIRGTSLSKGNNNCDQIEIEVKASIVTNVNSFRMKISRHEWDIALENLDSYFFYCLTGIDVDRKNCQYGPFIIPAIKIKDLMPVDKNQSYKWSECTAFIDLETMKIN